MLETLHNAHPLLPTVLGLGLLVLAAIVADLLAKRLMLATVTRLASRTAVAWDNALVESRVFNRLAMILPAIVLFAGVPLVPGVPEGLEKTVRNVASAWMILSFMLALSATLSALNWLYEQRPESRERPIKGFIQLAEIVVYLVGGILMIAALIDRSPVILLSGLGAMTAVLLIVFKDTLLSLAASIQLTSQKIIRVGDWLEIPQFGADGDVIDVALYTVTVQNWDKTITTIPTHRLISDSFKNWRGMQEAGGRRIKRSINVDMNSIRFLSAEEIERFKRFVLLRDYIDAKERELREYNEAIGADAEVNLRRLTNIGTLRAYIKNYLKNHPRVHEGMTLIVRQLQPGPHGLPIEVYCFSNDINWANYEAIQADIFDHICAIVPEFGLRLFQSPTGSDFTALAGRPAA
jgi:miniconductance mechanosensitive channel